MSYKTRDQMIAAWDALATTYPTVCSSEVIGKSVENRDLKLYKIGNPLGGRFAVVANTHGDEKANVEITYLFASWVVSSSDAEAVRIRERNLLLIIPMLGIDEYDIQSQNHNGTNLDFNFDYEFGETGSGVPGNWQYRGPYALSEPESVAAKKFFMQWMPRHLILTHDGSSGYSTWVTEAIEASDLDIHRRVYHRYQKRALGDGRAPYAYVEVTVDGGNPKACAYHHSGHKILAWVVECCTFDPEFSTIASTHYPNMKPFFLTLAQESELAADPQEGPAVELTFGSVVPADSEVVNTQVVLGCTEEMSSFSALLQNWDEKYSPGGTYPITKGLAATVKIGRGNVTPQLLTGRVELVRGIEDADGRHYLSLWGRSTYEHLLRRVVARTYANIRAELLVEDILETFTDLQHLIADADDDTPAFSTCTEVDPNGRFTVTDHRIYISGLARNEDAYVYKDFGVDGITDFEFWLDIRGKGGSVYGASCFGSCGVDLDDFYGWVTGNHAAVTIILYNDNSSPMKQVVKIQEAYGGSVYDSATKSFTLGQVLFCIFRKIGTMAWLEIYDDAERTRINEILTLNLQQYHSFRYFMPCQSYNNASSLAFNGYVGQASLVEPSDTSFARLDYDDVNVNDVLKMAAKNADRDGVIGFEIRTNPDGKFAFFPVGAKVVADVDITEILEKAEWDDDITRIRNKIRIRGAPTADLPRSRDRWTEPVDASDPPAHWVCVGTRKTTGVINRPFSIARSTTWKKLGTYSIKLYLDDPVQNDDYMAECYLKLNDEAGTERAFRLDSEKILVIWINNPTTPGGVLRNNWIRLCTDLNNYFEYQVTTGALDGWGLRVNLGKQNEKTVDNPDGIWEAVGSPDWHSIKDIYLKTPCWASGEDFTVFLDAIFLNKDRWEHVEENGDSQSAYGLREYSDVDEELISDEECVTRAKAILAWLKDSAQRTETSSEILVYVDKPILAGDVAHHHIPNLNVDGDYRVNRIVYEAFGDPLKVLKVSFSLGKEPNLLADWLYDARRKISSHATNKQGPPY